MKTTIYLEFNLINKITNNIKSLPNKLLRYLNFFKIKQKSLKK